MKKILLVAAVAATVASGAYAQKNYVVNGDFEQTEGLVQSIPWDWDESKLMIEELPGWEVKDLNPWSVLAGIMPTEIDDEYTFDGNKNCLHLYRFDDNGWTAGSVMQVVKGLTVGEEYVLGAIIARAGGETVDWDDPYFSISLMPLDENCEEFGASALFDDRDEALAESDIWGEYQHKFKASSPNMRLTISHNNTKWEGNHSSGFWMDVDDVAIMTPEDYAEYFANKENTGVNEIFSGANAKVTGIYNLSGVKVAENLDAISGQKGLFIVKTSEGTKKVIL